MEYAVCRDILMMVSELHVRGYQCLRIAPGMAPSGCYWRCSITPASNISIRHGAMLVSWDELAAHYSSSSEREYFGWTDVSNLTASRLAARFIERCPDIVAAGRGSDWLYSGWFQEMLGITYPDVFPIAYADWDLATDYLETVGGRQHIRVPLPPPGECPEGLPDA